MEAILEKKSNLVMPTCGYELDGEEMSYVDGGGIIAINLQFSVGAMIASFGTGFVTSFLITFASTYLAKKLPTWVGKLIGAAVGATVGAYISSTINGNSKIVSIPIFRMWLPFVRYNKTFDLGDKVFDVVSGIVGGFGGGSAGGAFVGSLAGAIA